MFSTTVGKGSFASRLETQGEAQNNLNTDTRLAPAEKNIGSQHRVRTCDTQKRVFEKVLPSILLNIAHRIISYILAAQIFDTRKI